MDEKRARVEERMRNGTIKFDAKPTKKESWVKAILKWPFRSFIGLLGVDLKDLSGYSSRRGRMRGYEGPIMSPHLQSGSDFRDNYRVANLTNSVEFQNAMQLARMGDGRGDPPAPCNCDHDER